MSEFSLEQFNAACNSLATGAGQGRVDAEQYLLRLRSSEDALAIARFVIDSAATDTSSFQAAIIMKEVVLRDWAKLPAEARNELKGYIIHHVVQRQEAMPPYLRRQLLQVVCIIIKRGWFEDPPDFFTGFVTFLENLLKDPATRTVGAYIMLALVEEFSTNNRSMVGLSWEFHNKTQAQFVSDGHLKHVFMMLLALFSATVDDIASGVGEEATRQGGAFAWLGPAMEVVTHTIAWDFSGADSKGDVLGSFKSPTKDVITPGVVWRDVFVQPATIDLFYRLYAACRAHTTLSHASRQILVDLAGIRGDVFPNEDAKQAYFEHSLDSVLALISSSQDAAEWTDQAHILQRLVTNFPSNKIRDATLLRSTGAPQHLERICAFTCMLMQGGASDHYAEEALDHMLEAWSFLAVAIQYGGEGPGGALERSVGVFTAKVFRSFVDKCLREAAKEIEEWDQADEDHEDKSLLEERLTAIGCISRLSAADSLPFLEALLRQRIVGIEQSLESESKIAPAELGVVFEQLHWLIRISGHLVADEGEGEVPSIPDSISFLSSRSDPSQGEDPVVSLTSALVGLARLEGLCLGRGRVDLLSPLVVETTTWFLARWSSTFLLPQESHRGVGPPPSLLRLYGPGDGANQVLAFMLEFAASNLTGWTSEDGIASATGSLLLCLASRRPVAKLLIAAPGWAALAAAMPQQIQRSGGVLMSPAALSQTMQALCMSASAEDDDPEQRSTTLRELLGPVVAGLASALSHAVAGPTALDSVLRGASMLSGASKASDFYTADTIFEMVAPILDACPPALVACQDRQDVTAAVVGLYVSIAESQVSWLSVEQMSIFDLACLKLLRTFAGIEEQDSVRGKASWRRTEREDWLGHHMLALLQLLLNLARHGDRTDSVDFSKEARGGHMDVADVVLYGLGLIQPLITPEALQVPALAKAFFNLLGWLMEAHPHKIAELEKSVADPLMACLLHGLQHMDADLSRVAVEAIDALASHHVTMVQVNGTCLMKTAHPSLLATFLRALLEMLLFREFNRGMLDACCDALLSLMLCEQACFTELMGGVVQGQVLDSLRHQVGEATTVLIGHLTTTGGFSGVNRSAKQNFRKHMRTFLGTVRPFLVRI